MKQLYTGQIVFTKKEYDDFIKVTLIFIFIVFFLGLFTGLFL